jgi:hypothetical protein
MNLDRNNHRDGEVAEDGTPIMRAAATEVHLLRTGLTQPRSPRS